MKKMARPLITLLLCAALTLGITGAALAAQNVFNTTLQVFDSGDSAFTTPLTAVRRGQSVLARFTYTYTGHESLMFSTVTWVGPQVSYPVITAPGIPQSLLHPFQIPDSSDSSFFDFAAIITMENALPETTRLSLPILSDIPSVVEAASSGGRLAATVVGVKEFAHVRENPGTDANIIGRVTLGEEIELIEWNGARTWARVLYNGGQNAGWLFGRFIQRVH